MVRRKRDYDRRKLIALGIIAFILAGVLALFIFNPIQVSGNASKNTGSTARIQQVTKENFPQFLRQQSIMRDMPDDAHFSVNLYNFDKGYREVSVSYEFKGAGAKEDSTPDMDLFLDEKYLDSLGKNFCGTLSAANTNGDLGYEIKKSTALVLWKYKSMNKNKACLGI